MSRYAGFLFSSVAWIKYPFIRLLIPFMMGVIGAEYIPINLKALCWFVGLCAAISWLIHFKVKTNFEFRPVFGYLVMCFFCASGIIWYKITDEQNRPNHFENKKSNIVGVLYGIEEKTRFYDCYVQVLGQGDENILVASGNLLVRIPLQQSYTPHLRDRIQAWLTPQVINGPTMPFEFNWKSMMMHRNVNNLAYLDTSRYSILHQDKDNLLERSRTWIDQSIKRLVENKRDYPVAVAMLLGIRKKIDPELYQAYSSTGAVHILAVSGMHVGILVQVLQWIFSLFNHRFAKIQLILMLAVVWFYTLLTGATPSILRASLMFSVFIIAKGIHRDTASMNVLAGSAFVLLLINPRDVFNIGFQLSYGAMAGILIAYEPIRKLVTTTNKLAQMIWKMIAVSVAAQLFIYPVIGFYFHQFAFYFWLTSLLSAPFSFVILSGGIFSMVTTHWLPESLAWLHWPLIYGVKWMNDVISWIYTLPMGNISGWWPSLPQTLLLIGISICLAGFILVKQFPLLILSISLALIFIGTLFIRSNIKYHSGELVIGKIRNQQQVWLRSGTYLYVLRGDTSVYTSKYVDYYNIKDDYIRRLDPEQSIDVHGVFFSQKVIETNTTTYLLSSGSDHAHCPERKYCLPLINPSSLQHGNKGYTIIPLNKFKPTNNKEFEAKEIIGQDLHH